MVVAIEGIDELYCTADAAKVATAWSGTDWTSATADLFVDLEHKQKCSPWEPFNGGGSLTFTIQNDDFGVLTHRTTGTADTELVTGLDRDDTTVTVKDTSAFSASGHIFIGNETISYASKNATQFLTCVRGLYHPIGCDPSGLGGDRFAHPHRVDTVAYAPPVGPRVTQFPVEWVGRWVTLTVHGYESDGSLQLKDDALRVFAGRIAEVRDEPDTLGTIVVCDDILTVLKEMTVGSDLFTGTLADGIYLKAGLVVDAFDWNGTTKREANALTWVTSGAAGANQANEGYYTQEALHTVLNTWLASELAASRLHGTYIFVIDYNAGPITKIGWEIAGAGAVVYGITVPKNIALFMGFAKTFISDTDSGSVWHSTPGQEVPLRIWSPLFSQSNTLLLENLSGQFADGYSTMPLNMKPTVTGPDGSGLFIFDDRFFFSASVEDNGDDTFTLDDVRVWWEFGNGGEDSTPQSYSKRVDEDGSPKIRQVFIFEGAASMLLNQLMYSVGNGTAYNDDTYDDWPFGAGAAIPGGLLGAAWETSVANLPAADKPIAIVISKPEKLSAVIGSDLTLRFAFPVWRDGGLQMAAWQTPSASLAVATLTEDNKAEPSTSADANHRIATLLSDRFKSNQIKIRYSRSLLGEDKYRNTAIVEDRTTIDDGGNARSPRTIDARNTYDEFSSTGSAIEDIVPNTFIPVVTLFTRAMRTLTRSIDINTAHTLAPGDVVNVEDTFARDPDTGERGISSRPATVIGVGYSPGGAQPGGSTAPMVGEVELMLTRGNRFYAYAPSVVVDQSVSGGGFSGGYNAGTKTLRCLAHAHSEASEAADASHLATDYWVEVTEIDPDDPATALTWTDQVVGVSGNDVQLDTGLAGFDDTKEYRITFAGYGTVQAVQQDKAFQADDADGLIADEAQANTFGLAVSGVTYTLSEHTDLPERHADVLVGDGVAYDGGSELGHERLINNLIDHKMALSVPVLGSTVASNSTYSTGNTRKTVLIMPIALTTAGLSNSIMRYVSIAPWLRSSDGTATHVRISLCEHPPSDTSLDDMDIPTPNDQATWNTSSTTWATGTPTTLSLAIKDGFGWGWLIVECAYKAETRGIAKFVEEERAVFV